MATKTDIDLYTAGTPNGHKINITMEELGLTYRMHAIDISKNEQKEDWFLQINPNGRIPALVDHSTSPPTRVFEGASMQLYLCARHDAGQRLSFAYDSALYWWGLSWLVWMQSGLGPMQGQANHFVRYAPEKIEYAVRRYQTETKRLYGVLDERLAAQERAEGGGLWVVGGKYSIVDICCFSWVNWAEWAGVEVTAEAFPALERWLRAIQARPAVERGCNIPEKFEMKEKLKTKEGTEEFEKYHGDWVMQGMKEDQEKHS